MIVYLGYLREKIFPQFYRSSLLRRGVALLLDTARLGFISEDGRDWYLKKSGCAEGFVEEGDRRIILKVVLFIGDLEYIYFLLNERTSCCLHIVR